MPSIINKWLVANIAMACFMIGLSLLWNWKNLAIVILLGLAFYLAIVSILYGINRIEKKTDEIKELIETKDE